MEIDELIDMALMMADDSAHIIWEIEKRASGKTHRISNSSPHLQDHSAGEVEPGHDKGGTANQQDIPNLHLSNPHTIMRTHISEREIARAYLRAQRRGWASYRLNTG